MSASGDSIRRRTHRRPLLLLACGLALLLCGGVPAVQGLVTGAHWYDATGAAPFAARYGHSSVVFNDGTGDKIWVMGGYDLGTYQVLNDVLSSPDGSTWTSVTDSAGFQARAGHSSVDFKGKIWVVGGYAFDEFGNLITLNDVWSSPDGVLWEEANSSAFTTEFTTSRYGHSSAVFKGDLWVIGGNDDSGLVTNDTWSSADGITWVQENPAAEFQPRASHSSVDFKNRLWVIGGTGFDGDFNTIFFNDTWSSSDGNTWELANASAEFPARYAHTSLVDGNKIWVFGGTDDISIFNDSWYSSDGEIWYQATGGAEFPARYYHSSVSYDGKMWVMGGVDNGGMGFNDVWYSPLPAALDVTAITPSSGVNSSAVDITDLAGNGFIRGATVNLTRAGYENITATGANVLSPSRISCSFPITGAEWGIWNVTVTNPDGQSDTLLPGFIVRAPAPTVESIAPDHGYNTALMKINYLIGSNFLAGANVILVNASAGPDITATNVSIDTDGKIINCTFNLVGAPAANRSVTVTNADGMSGTLANMFNIVPRFPVVTNMIPSTSENSGVVNVTIIGTDFVAGAIVRLENVTWINATNVSVNSETNITCSFNLAAVADGSWTLNVINPGNQGNNIFQFVIYAAKSSTGNTGGNGDTGGTGSTTTYSGGYGGSTGGTSGAAPAAQSAAAEPEAGTATQPGAATGELSVTSKGVVTREASLESEDGVAEVSIPAGVVALDAAGSALGSVSMTPLAPSAVPADTPGSAFSFAGMAYDLGPDGATFSPAITLSFTVPGPAEDQDYTIRMLDEATNTWMDVPTTYHPESGTVTAEVSHFCCFALFTKTPVTAVVTAAAPQPTSSPKPAPTPPPTAMSIFSGLILWVANQGIRSPVVIVVIIILAVAIIWFGKRQYKIYRITRPRKKP